MDVVDVRDTYHDDVREVSFFIYCGSVIFHILWKCRSEVGDMYNLNLDRTVKRGLKEVSDCNYIEKYNSGQRKCSTAIIKKCRTES